MKMENINYGIMVVDPTTLKNDSIGVNHFVGYETEPTPLDYIMLYQEIMADNFFQEKLKGKQFILIPAPYETVLSFKQEIQNNSDDIDVKVFDYSNKNMTIQ